MKINIRKTLTAVTLIFTLAATSFSAQAQDNAPVYDKTVNTAIGITVANATGQQYIITDKSGKIIMKGIVKSGKTFYISTGKLKEGTYRFSVAGNTTQQFVIK